MDGWFFVALGGADCGLKILPIIAQLFYLCSDLLVPNFVCSSHGGAEI